MIRALIDEGRTLELVQGDITRESTDAIVNAANSELAVGGGVCGAIHRTGGLAIAEECKQVRAQRGPLPPGQAAATTGGQLKARYVIHAVGPVWAGGNRGEPQALASCYHESLRVADELGVRSVAFPAISTGIYGYPARPAAEVAVAAARESLLRARTVRTVRFVVFDQATFEIYSAILKGPPATLPRTISG